MTDYKEKYEQAISRAKEILSRATETIRAMTDMGGVAKVDDILHIFPELSESEDERIKRCIGICLTDATEQRFEDFNTTLKDCLAWLEKQGGKVDVLDDFPTEFERQISHLIASSINKEWEYKKDFVKHTANALLQYAKNELEKRGELKLLNNEEYQTLPVETLDRLYAAEKELEQLKQGKHKHSWNEEDREMFDAVIADVLFTQKAHNHEVNQVVYEREIDWLKSLKPQNRQKLSKEQLKVDLEKELTSYYNEHFSPCENGVLMSEESGRELDCNDYESIARHFYELGLNSRKEE